MRLTVSVSACVCMHHIAYTLMGHHLMYTLLERWNMQFLAVFLAAAVQTDLRLLLQICETWKHLGALGRSVFCLTVELS